MRKVILNMTMTFDGFFNLDWMVQRRYTSDQELNDHHFHYGYFVKRNPLRAAPTPQPGAQSIDAPYPLSLTD